MPPPCCFGLWWVCVPKVCSQSQSGCGLFKNVFPKCVPKANLVVVCSKMCSQTVFPKPPYEVILSSVSFFVFPNCVPKCDFLVDGMFPKYSRRFFYAFPLFLSLFVLFEMFPKSRVSAKRERTSAAGLFFGGRAFLFIRFQTFSGKITKAFPNIHWKEKERGALVWLLAFWHFCVWYFGIYKTILLLLLRKTLWLQKKIFPER